jgi:hypothetical protein
MPKECTFHPKLVTKFKPTNSNYSRQISHTQFSNSSLSNSCRGNKNRNNIVKQIKQRESPNLNYNFQTCPGRNKIITTETFDIKETNEENLLTE